MSQRNFEINHDLISENNKLIRNHISCTKSEYVIFDKYIKYSTPIVSSVSNFILDMLDDELQYFDNMTYFTDHTLPVDFLIFSSS